MPVDEEFQTKYFTRKIVEQNKKYLMQSVIAFNIATSMQII